MCKQEIGLTTQQALHRLYDDIDSILREFHHSQSTRHTSAWLCDSLHYSSEYTTLTVISVFAIVLIILMLLIVEIFITHDSTLFYQAAFLLIFLFINTYLVLSDNKFRHEEVPKRVVSILATIKLAIKNVKWLPENYPQLCSPFSPCVTTQWVYRDGCLINLPWALLVRDDIIVIRPGQLSPGDCKALDENSDCPILNANEVYGPALPTAHEIFSAPKARIPLKNKKYVLIETPYIRNLRVALDRALDRPITHFNRQRHLLINKCVEHYCFPIVLVFVIVFNFIRYMYLHKYFGRGHWVEMCVLQPICVILPLLPLVFPTIWLILNAFGMARFKTLFNTTSKKSLMSETQIFAEPDSCVDPDLDFTYQWAEVWDIFVNIITGKELMMTRSSNILHVFGSLSALCVVDKKGILSWPNPTAEKVFFLRSSGSISHSSSLGSMNDSDVDADSIRTSLKHVHNGSLKGTTAEVLDVTHDHKYPFRLEFDDHSWHQYLPSLKPLGLAILLNTCNVETQETYSQFCSHVTCEAMYNENLVPVTNRRCLCELAKQIGFVDKAQEIFSTEEQLSTFRHLTDTIKRDKFVKSLHLSTKLKFPFPHMFAVIVKELNSGTHQLLSQGTADVILDSCIDFWDGKDLCPLSTSDRKKIMDFYQRTSLTAYCTAFAYRPLTRPFDNKLSEIYLELPSDSRHLYMPHRSPTPLHWDFKSMLEPRIKGTLGQFHSTDSLLYNDTKEEAVSDVEGCFEAQCHQVFMGMVTMQYQAQADMVSLIEQLERACVRFVHFSKENELRSRVFSEKMGLESGWNCHISLHSERSRPMRLTNLDSTKPISFSAPSAINLDYSVVKFEEDVEIGLSGDWADSAEPTQKLAKDNFDGCKIIDSDNKDTESAMEDGDITGSKDSVMVQSVDLSSHQEGWQSLSCLTDSTEQSAPVNFDMSNRAKLPRGIENIRPHLESVDNVPLLVSLFTDCTARVTCEMLKIMQDYGQIVCVLGSAANADNMEIFMQADASIAVEPLYPQVCQRVPVYTPVAPVHGPSPVGLSRSLNAIACSLAFRREDPVSLYHLVLESRHYMLSLWNCVQFWVCCSVSVTFLQLFGIILMLPPIFSSAQVVWLICFIIPILSISLIGLPTDPLVMQRPAAKFQYSVNTEMVVFVIWCYCAKFLSVIIFTLMSYGGTLVGFCNDIALTTNGTICRVLYPFPTNEDTIWLGWGGHSYSLLTAQHLTAFIAVAHLIIVSSTFVHREYSVWYRKPFENKLWISVATMLLIVQVLFSTVALTVFSERNSTDVELTIVDVPWPVLFFMIISFGLTYAVVEFLKWQEIKVNLRYLRRARLDFGTKLGMNSPF